MGMTRAPLIGKQQRRSTSAAVARAVEGKASS